MIKKCCNVGIFLIFTLKVDHMVKKVTEGITISVETFYQPDYSISIGSEFMFAYRITIENNNTFPIKLLRRHWYIIDSNGSHREVEGEGVVGVQPLLAPNERLSVCFRFQPPHGESVKCTGTYQMENQLNKKLFDVKIPEFQMVVPFKMN